ncbi:MAG: uroporphyrinogen decarboxylase family protein [Promethearchaeota archaeon]
MDVLERFRKVFNHEEPDRIPTFTQTIEPEFIERYDEEYEIVGAELLPSIGLQLAKELGYDSIWIHIGHTSQPEAEQPEIPRELKYLIKDREINKFGQVFIRNSNTGEKWYIDGILKQPELLKEWIEYLKSIPEPDEKRYKDFKKNFWDYSLKYDILPIPTAGGIAHITISSIGIDRFSFFVRKHKKLLKELFKIHKKLTIEQHKLLFEQGVEMVFICDDYAQKGRLMISPANFQEFIEPIYKELADNAHKYNARFLVHSDGDISESFPSLVRAGVDAAEPLEYEAGMRIKPLKEKYGDKITLIGNIPASDVICLGSVEDTIKITKQCILDGAENGGLILGQGANLLGKSKIENVKAMLETIKKYGIYPIDYKKLRS